MPELSSAVEIVYNLRNAGSAFYGNTRVWRSPFYIKNTPTAQLSTYDDGRQNFDLGVGTSQLLYITPDGYLRSSGLGGTYSEGVVPVAYRGQNLVKKVWCRFEQSFIFTSDNLLIGWGRGFGAVNNIPTALKTQPGNNLRSFAWGSQSHAAAVKSDGTAVVWTDTPASLPHMSVINAGGAATSGTGNWTNLKKIVASGSNNFVGLREDGSLVASFTFPGTYPTTGIKDVFWNYYYTAFLTNDGRLFGTSGLTPPAEFQTPGTVSNFTSSGVNDGYLVQKTDGTFYGTNSNWSSFPAAVLNQGLNIKHFYMNGSWACAAIPKDDRKSEIVFWGAIRSSANTPNVDNTGYEDHPQAPRDIYTYWTPYDINTSAWIDPSDRNYISLVNSTKVSTVFDKKNSGRSFTQATDANRPRSSYDTLTLLPNAIFNNNRGIWFETSSQILNSQVSSVSRNIFDLDAGTAYTQESIFAVIKKNQDTTSNSCLFQESGLGGGILAGRNIFWDTLNRFYMDFGTNADNTQINRLVVQNFFPSPYPSLVILSITMDTAPTGANPGFSVWINGTLKATGTALPNAVCKAGGATALGNNGGGAFLNGTLGEIVMLNYIPAKEIRQKIEGYLAWKFQMASSLPSDHPYKTNQPLRA